MACDVRIGTSGFHYKHWKGPFYPAKLPAGKMLGFYSEHFYTVELNNSFYRLPEASAFDGWREATPENFVFSVKASRFITHNKKFKDPEHALDNLLLRAVRLGPKLGPILFQLPPHWRVNPERLRNLLEMLPRELSYTFEFRELSWINPEVDSILKKFNAAFCIYELAGYHSPLHVTADFAYVRLHGPESGKYQGSLRSPVKRMGPADRNLVPKTECHLRVLRQRPAWLCRGECPHLKEHGFGNAGNCRMKRTRRFPRTP
jgi:uncharacterized protein YecE (DUF72 family)